MGDVETNEGVKEKKKAINIEGWDELEDEWKKLEDEWKKLDEREEDVEESLVGEKPPEEEVIEGKPSEEEAIEEKPPEEEAIEEKPPEEEVIEEKPPEEEAIEEKPPEGKAIEEEPPEGEAIEEKPPEGEAIEEKPPEEKSEEEPQERKHNADELVSKILQGKDKGGEVQVGGEVQFSFSGEGKPSEAIPEVKKKIGFMDTLFFRKSPRDLKILKTIDGKKNLGEISGETGIDMQTLNGLIDKLVTEGYITIKSQ